MKFSKQVLIALIVAVVCTAQVNAACANREKDASSDLYEDIKCGLSSASDKLKDGVTSVGSSLKDGSTKALDAITKAASKTGSALRDGLDVVVEKSKSGYEYVRDAVKGKKVEEVQPHHQLEDVIDVRGLNLTNIQ
jgi:hypothetical protein